MKNRIITLLILLLAITTCHAFEVDGIYYYINTDNSVAITSGDNKYFGDIIIPETVIHNGVEYSVTSISEEAFYCCNQLNSVNICNSVTSIGEHAFNECTGLTSVTIGNSVTSIGDYAFSKCFALTSIEIPNSVISIGHCAFSECYGMTNITVGNSVSYIGHGAFDGTKWFNDQPDGLVYAGQVAYQYKGYMPNGTNITLRNGTLGIASSAFVDCSGMNSITIPNSVKVIGEDAFCYCTGLTNVTIPNSVTTIEDYAFAVCSRLTRIDINGSPYVGSNAFEGCLSLTKVNISSIADWCGIHFMDFSANPLYYAKHLYLNGEEIVDLVIPDNTLHIGQLAFVNCESLRSVTIPVSITKMEAGAFWGCTQLEKVNIFDIGAWCAINFEFLGGLYEEMADWMYDAANPLAHAQHLYLNGQEIKHIIIPESTQKISQFAFTRCKDLISVTIPNTVTSIGDCAFYHCSNLSNIIIPNSVKSIGLRSFENCISLTNIEIGNSVSTIDRLAFRACDNVSNVVCYAATPPVCDDETFSNYYATLSNYSASLHVPAASLAAYFTAPCWRNFENIVGDAVAPIAITISMNNVEMTLGEQLTLLAMVLPANASNKEVIWVSSDPTIVTVNNGTLTALGYGECDIIALCFGMQAICHVSVTNRITLDQQEAMLLPNHILTLTPIAPIMPEDFIVTSSDPTVAAVRVMNRTVQVVGIKEGTATITVGSTDGTALPASCLVTIYTELGDLNCDGFVNINDVTSLINYLLSGNSSLISTKNADVNGDDSINIRDVTTLINKLLNDN